MTIPTPPAPRIAYDIDGSVVITSQTGGVEHAPFTLPESARMALNSDLSQGLVFSNDFWNMPPATDVVGDGYYAKNYISVIFPRLMNIKGFFSSAYSLFSYPVPPFSASMGGPTQIEFQVSRNTTNGVDGTWQTVSSKSESDFWLGVSWGSSDFQYPAFDVGLGDFGTNTFWSPDNSMFGSSGPSGAGWSMLTGADSVSAVRILFPTRPSNVEVDYSKNGKFLWLLTILHLYGVPSAEDDRLSFVSSDGTSYSDLSIGDLDIDSSITKSFKVQNVSATFTAKYVRITLPVTSPKSQTSFLSEGEMLVVPDWRWAVRLSIDGQSWLPTVELGDLSPGESSSEILLRIAPVPGMVGLRFVRLLATARGWS